MLAHKPALAEPPSMLTSRHANYKLKAETQRAEFKHTAQTRPRKTTGLTGRQLRDRIPLMTPDLLSFSRSESEKLSEKDRQLWRRPTHNPPLRDVDQR